MSVSTYIRVRIYFVNPALAMVYVCTVVNGPNSHIILDLWIRPTDSRSWPFNYYEHTYIAL